MTSEFYWKNSIRLCPASFCIPRPNLPVTSGVSWLPTFAFQSPIMNIHINTNMYIYMCVCLCVCVRRHWFDPWVGKIPWRRAWQTPSIFLAWRIPWTKKPGGFHSKGSQTVT